MNRNKRVIRKYLKEVRDALTCPRAVKSVYIGELKNSIIDFAGDDIIDIEDIYDKFGTPESIADGFCGKSEYKDLLKKAKKRSLIWKLVFTVFVIIFALFIAFAARIIAEVISDLGTTVTFSGVYDITYGTAEEVTDDITD